MEFIESQHMELKRELTAKLEQTVIAFLNSKDGGVIYFGVDDDGTVYGVEKPDFVQRQIADRIKNNIRGETLGLFDIVLEKADEKNIIKLIISSGTEKPYYLKEKGMTSDGCFIRSGSRIEQMTNALIEKVFARRTRNSLSVITSPRQDLTFEQLKIYYLEHGKVLNEQFAASLNFLTEAKKYNLTAFLFADQNDVTIKVAKFAGTDKTELIENEEYGYCSIIKSCKAVLDKLNVENRTFAKITYPFRHEQRMIDSDSLREAVINAFVHNDYSDLMSPAVYIFSDRIEIVSYGGLIDGMSKDELISGCSRPRNREIMRIFKDVELVEQLGTGMNRMMKAYTPDIFALSPNFFRTIFPYKSLPLEEKKIPDGGLNGGIPLVDGGLTDGINALDGGLNLSESEKLVLREIQRDPYVTNSGLVQLTTLSSRTIDRCIKSLREKYLIAREGSKKTGHWKILGGAAK